MEHDPHIIGTIPTASGEAPFAFTDADRRLHLYAIGKSGSGKTTLLSNLVLGDLEAGFGVGLVDLHGDLARRIIDCMPPQRTEHVAYFDVSDPTHAIGFNPLAHVPPARRSAAAEEMVSAFRSQWGDQSWGPVLEQNLRYGLLSLLELETATLFDLPRLFRDADYLTHVRTRIVDKAVRRFWAFEWDPLSKQDKVDRPNSLLNKVNAFLASPVSRAILGQRYPRFDLRTCMDRGHVAIANFAKGHVGAGHAELLSALFVSHVNSTAMRRADMPEHQRRPFRLIIDECQNVAPSALESLASESRKFSIELALSNQTCLQLPPVVLGAILTSVTNLIAFRISHRDAEIIAPEIGIDAAALSGQPSRHAWVRREHHVNPVAMRDFAPRRHGRLEKVRAASRMRFALLQETVERRL